MTEFREKDMVKVAALVAQLQDELGRKDDLLAVAEDDKARMAKRIAMLVKGRDEAHELADYYRNENIAIRNRLFMLAVPSEGEA